MKNTTPGLLRYLKGAKMHYTLNNRGPRPDAMTSSALSKSTAVVVMELLFRNGTAPFWKSRTLDETDLEALRREFGL